MVIKKPMLLCVFFNFALEKRKNVLEPSITILLKLKSNLLKQLL